MKTDTQPVAASPLPFNSKRNEQQESDKGSPALPCRIPRHPPRGHQHAVGGNGAGDGIHRPTERERLLRERGTAPRAERRSHQSTGRNHRVHQRRDGRGTQLGFTRQGLGCANRRDPCRPPHHPPGQHLRRGSRLQGHYAALWPPHPRRHLPHRAIQWMPVLRHTLRDRRLRLQGTGQQTEGTASVHRQRHGACLHLVAVICHSA